jgi:protoporphyrin/coproporphyrin ferrochelatase
MKSQSTQTGLVLLNLGTPDSPKPSDVRRYLKQFLMDPDVVDIPFLFRWLLVHGAILPKRPITSGAAYQKIWTDRGSPLSFHLMDLVARVSAEFKECHVVPAMRYGNPSIDEAFSRLKQNQVKELIIFPLYPQYSLAATESSIKECRRVIADLKWDVSVRFVPAFFEEPSFIEAFVQIARESLKDYSYDHILFSFHGLPERQVKKTDCSGTHCLSHSECCKQVSLVNQNCYRAQCFRTAHLMAEHLQLSSQQFTVCFQSRLGKTPWIKPFSDQFYRDLPKQGIKRLAVICPSFVADCLETLEEVQIRGREEFVQNGGEDLKLVPSLNSSKIWVQSVVQIIRPYLEDQKGYFQSRS